MHFFIVWKGIFIWPPEVLGKIDIKWGVAMVDGVLHTFLLYFLKSYILEFVVL